MHTIFWLVPWLTGCDDHVIGSAGPHDGADTDPSANAGPPGIPPTTRLARLTTLQWELAVQDLLYLGGPTGLSEGFIGDPLSEGFDNNGANLDVGPELWQDHQRAAEALAVEVVSDPDLYAAVVPGASIPGTAFTATVEGEDPDVMATTGTSGANDYNLWSVGELVATFDIPVDGAYRLQARVFADQAGNELPRATLGVDGTVLLTEDIQAASSASADLLEVSVSLTAGRHDVHVGFLNDFYDPYTGADRNLRIDWVAVVDDGEAGSAPDATEWITTFGSRAHRRPLTPTEIDDYLTLFDLGPVLVDSGNDFADGVQIVITAMLQSPHFIYRIEESTTELSDGRIPLSSYEIASKLSFALWNTMPDAALFDVASADALTEPDQIRAQAERMMADPRARDTVVDLHRQLLSLDTYPNIHKDPVLYPTFTETTPASMRAEAEAFVDDVITSGGGVHQLYTAPYTFANADLGPIYGVEAPGTALERVSLDPTERAGLLTLSGVLAVQADAVVHNPIRRGVFVAEEVLCAHLPPPPDDVTPLPPPDGVRTTRELVDAHTGKGTCGEGCHSTIINPPGFAFENYDALGQYRDVEYGFAIDATGAWTFESGPSPFVDAVDFATQIAQSTDGHRCYIDHWLTYLHGRPSESQDSAVLESLAVDSLAEDRPITDLMIDLLVTDSFRFRNPAPLEVSR